MPQLVEKLRRLIVREGPVSLSDFMAVSLHDPEEGYYAKGTAFLSPGDFTTAPEISQMFGELLGLWVGALWQDLDCPESFKLIELGPGRGTLLDDALRALAKLPEIWPALELHLVDNSPVLKERQMKKLKAWREHLPITWHSSLVAFCATKWCH